MASWTLSRHLWKSAPCPRLPSCPTPGPDAGRGHTPSFLLSCPSQAPEPGPAGRPRFALGLSLQWETLRSAGEEGDSCPASLPTQQLRPPARAGEGTQPPFQVPPFLPRGPRLSLLLPGQRSPFFLCRFISQEGSFSQKPCESSSVPGLTGPWLSLLTPFWENVTPLAPPALKGLSGCSGGWERTVGEGGRRGGPRPSFCFAGSKGPSWAT